MGGTILVETSPAERAILADPELTREAIRLANVSQAIQADQAAGREVDENRVSMLYIEGVHFMRELSDRGIKPQSLNFSGDPNPDVVTRIQNQAGGAITLANIMPLLLQSPHAVADYNLQPSARPQASNEAIFTNEAAAASPIIQQAMFKM